jgi:hypothetical protein
MVEPTPGAFIHKLQQVLGSSAEHSEASSLESIRSAVTSDSVLILDQFESFSLIETWLRTHFMPAMAGKLKLLLSGRLHPDNQWVLSPPPDCRYRQLRLECLPFTTSVAFLEAQGLNKVQAMGIYQFAQGHPVALKLAGAALLEQPTRQLYQTPSNQVIQTLVQFFIEDIKQADLRTALEAACVIRRVSESLLAAMLAISEQAATDLYSRLETLELVELTDDGLTLHEVLRKVLSAELKARAPMRYCNYRRSASQLLMHEMKQASAGQLWRYTADILYLVDNVVIRSAFFPPDDLREYSVMPAQEEDRDAVMQIIARHEPDTALAIYANWWQYQLSTFHCVKDSDNSVVGFYCLIKPADVSAELLKADPVTAHWMQSSNSKGQSNGAGSNIFIRRWLSLDDGEGLCGVQAACWLDIKRNYLEMRPQLRKVYLPLNNLQPYAPVACELGFQVLDNTIEIGGQHYFSAMLDMGPDSVDGWIGSRLLQELDQSAGSSDAPEWFDAGARQICLDNQRVDLTPLEFGTLEMLVENQGCAIARKTLLKEVWGIEYDGASNVVDTIILSLRKKLQHKSTVIQSVRGTGYRYEEQR